MLRHPLQQLPETTFSYLLRWSRLFFWIVLALFSAVRFISLPFEKLKPEVILSLIPEHAGAVGFWAGFDYLFMAAYTLFFAVCCVWASGRYRAGSVWYSTGIVLAWLALLQLWLDMSENCCMWLLAIGKGNPALESWFFLFSVVKMPVFAASAAYMLITSVLTWFGMLKR